MPKKIWTEELREFFRQQGAKGGNRAARNMTKKARRERAQKAIAARWAKAREEAQQ